MEINKKMNTATGEQITAEILYKVLKDFDIMYNNGIPEEDIERRYYESISNLEKLIPVCEHVKIYDNSRSFTRIATFVNGKCVDSAEYLPEWCKSFVEK